jgi:hypothetical protein
MIDKKKDDIEALEAEFPPASGVVFSNARDGVLASGQSVLQSENGEIYEVSPDGTKKFVKKVDPPVEIDPAKKIELP